MESFYSAMFQANLLYGVTLNPDDFAEIGLIAWNFIGNKNTRLYKYTVDVGCNAQNYIELPCNVDIIEAVTAAGEDWNYTSNISNNGNIDSAIIEGYIEGMKVNKNHLYISGKYIDYERIGDNLYFHGNPGTVTILYRGVVVDDEGLPEISDKEAIAIATYVAYTQKFKEGLITNNAAITNMANLLKAEWLKYCDAARVTYINQNEMNDILDAKTSWNRKIFNKSYKPLK